jgi:antitoxin HigA-1
MARSAIHPGVLLKEDLADAGVSPSAFARDIGIAPARVARLLRGETAVDADMALRLAHWFGTDPRYWLNLQNIHDLRIAERRIGRAVRAMARRADNGQSLPRAD